MKNLTNKGKLVVLVSSLSGFFTSMGTYMQNHDGCDWIMSPELVVHIFFIVGTLTTSIAAALLYDVNEGGQ